MIFWQKNRRNCVLFLTMMLIIGGWVFPAIMLVAQGGFIDKVPPLIAADSPIFVDGDGGWPSVPGITGDGSQDDPYVIKDKIIDAGGVGDCILIQNTTKYFTILNCTVTHSATMPAAGIRVLNATNGKIEKNNCTANGGGIFVGSKATYVVISDNNATGNEFGIVINSLTKNITAVANNASSNTYNGIDVSADSTDIHVESNIVNNNGIEGISFWGNVTLSTVTGNNASGNGYEGLYVFKTFNTTFADNLVLGNQYRGVILSDGASNNTFSNNLISKNLGAGIETTLNCMNNTFLSNNVTSNTGVGAIFNAVCNGNLLYLNRFITNVAGNARDDATVNHWDNGSLGNYWHNYTGIDDNDDGIGDSAWLIPGSAGTYDNYPLWRDTNHPLHIIGNDGWVACFSAGNCTGSGTENDPYVLADRWYNAIGATSGIWIENSTVFFIIRDCTTNASAAWPHAGIRLTNVTNGILDHNNCSKNQGPGIHVENSCTFLSITNNYARENLYGILAMYGCREINFTDNIITASTGMGVVLSDDLSNISFSCNNFSDNTGSGLRIVNRCTNITIRDNVFSYNTMEGVYLSDCNFTRVEGNELYRNQIGVSLDTSAKYNRILGNYIHNNTRGIYARACSNNSIDENDILNNTGDGIYFDWGTANNTYILNTVIQNQNGIVFATGENQNHTFVSNIVANNTQYGVRVRIGGDGNLFFNNTFSGNNHANASDDALNNHWNNGSLGNFYGDYFGEDLNDDCIGDTAYIINGTSNAQDEFPILNDGDDAPPSLTVDWPSPYQVGGVQPPQFKISVQDLTLNTTGYTLNSINTTFVGMGGTIEPDVWNPLPNGTHIVTFFANDSFGRWSVVPVTLYKDIIPPTFLSTGLTTWQLLGNNTPAFMLDAVEGNPTGFWWFSYDNGATNISCSQSDTLSGWDLLPNGTVTVRFFTNDSVNNVGWIDVLLQRDCAPPAISATGLIAGTSYSSAPAISLAITEANRAGIWYSVDGGATNHTLAGLTGTIDAAVWASLSSGTVQVTFWCNDTLGNTASVTVIIVKSGGECDGCGDTTLYWVIGGAIAVGVIVAVAIIIKRRKNRAFYPNPASK